MTSKFRSKTQLIHAIEIAESQLELAKIEKRGIKKAQEELAAARATYPQYVPRTFFIAKEKQTNDSKQSAYLHYLSQAIATSPRRELLPFCASGRGRRNTLGLFR